MYCAGRNQYNPGMKRAALTLLALLIALALNACGGAGFDNPDIASAVTGEDGLARLETARGVMDFQVSSGLSGERLAGVRLRVADWKNSRLLYAEDPAGEHLPVAVPLAGDAAVRRLVMPPAAGGHNIASIDGPLDLRDYVSLGTLTEAALRERLASGPDEQVLIYLYDPAAPLALTGAPLDAYRTPIGNVTVLSPGGDLPADPALIIVPLWHEQYQNWEHRQVDRYLATRIGQRPSVDFRADLAFLWSYPAFELFPEELAFDAAGLAELTVVWRGAAPNPPPPWSIFVSTDREDQVMIEPEAAPLGPETPSQTFILTLSPQALAQGDYELQVFVQPFSEAFGLIDQARTLTTSFNVAEALPTQTPGPQVESLSYSPLEPRQGDLLHIEASGFDPREAVLLEFVGTEFNVRDALPTADAEGLFVYDLSLAGAAPGSYALVLTGTASGKSGEAFISVGVQVADAVVNRTELNLRTEPRPDAPVLEVLVNGDTLEIVAVNGDDSWLEVVTLTGVRGWVVTDLVQVNIDLSTVPWNSNWPAP